MNKPKSQLSGIYSTVKNDAGIAFRTGMLHLLSSSGIVQISGFVVTLVLVRVLSAEAVGHIRLIHSVLDFLILLGDFGLAMAMLKYISEPSSEEEKKSLLSHASYGILCTSFLTALLAFALSFIPGLLGSPTAQDALRWMVWLIPFATLFGIVVHWEHGRKRIKQKAWYELAQRITLVVFTLVGLFIAGYSGYLVGFSIGMILVTLVLLTRLPRDWWRLQYVSSLMRKLFRFGWYAMLANQFQVVVTTADVLMISLLTKDPAAVGIYGVMALFIRGLWILPNGIMQTSLPYLSEQSQNTVRLRDMLQRIMRKIALLMFILCVLLYLLAPTIIPLLFGETYAEGVPVFQVLVISLFFSALAMVNYTALLSMGQVKFNFYTVLVEAIVNIALNYWLITQYGMIGAAWATVVTFGVRYGLNTIFLNRQLSQTK